MTVEATPFGSIGQALELTGGILSAAEFVGIIFLITYIFLPQISAFISRELSKTGQADSKGSVTQWLLSISAFFMLADKINKYPVELKKNSVKAILSLLIVLLTWWVGAIPAIILGHLAVRDIKHNSDLRGMPLARMGLVFGYFFLFTFLGFIFLIDRAFFGVL